MRSRILRNTKRARRRCSGALRVLADSQRGFTIVEVVVSALLVATIAGATGTALIATSRMSGDQRFRSQAEALAQQDQERLRGMSIAQLNTLNQTRDVGPYNGVTYKVTSTGSYLSSAGSAACSSTGPGAAAFVKIRSEVDWPGNHVNNNLGQPLRRPKVVQESVITPPTGGTLVTNVVDQLDAPLSGASVSAVGPEADVTATTGAEGCTIMSGLPTTGYYVFYSKSNYVNPNGNANPVAGAQVNSAGTAFPSPNPVKLGQAGAIIAKFKTTMGGTTYTGQKAPSFSWHNPGMTTSKNVSVAPSGSPPKLIPGDTLLSWVWGQPFNLFPFTTGPSSYTGNYVAWAGKCDLAKPPANQTVVTVPPGVAADLNDAGNPVQPRILMPGLNLNVRWKPNAGGTLTAVPETQVTAAKITHQATGCNETWWPETGSNSPNPPGVLKFPGQPYAPNVANQRLAICVDYTRNGGSTYFHNDAPLVVANDNFTNPPAVNVDVDESTPANAGRCPV